ncbi:MAG: hypothetical protein ACYCYP_08665 [Leptospirales bacterium]
MWPSKTGIPSFVGSYDIKNAIGPKKIERTSGVGGNFMIFSVPFRVQSPKRLKVQVTFDKVKEGMTGFSEKGGIACDMSDEAVT